MSKYQGKSARGELNPQGSALAGLITLLDLVNNIDAALAADELIGAMAPAQGF
jgi:hypothetical protein